MKQYKYILLDWDGSLVRTLDVWLAALKAPLEARGYSFSDKEIGANFAIFQERMEAHGLNDVATIIAEAKEITKRKAPHAALYPGVPSTLRSLRKSGKKIGLVTTSKHSQVDPLLEKYQLQELFDTVVCGDDVTYHKPHPEPIQKAMQLLGAGKEQTVMVGDSDSDIIAAASAGIDSVLLYPPEHTVFYDFAVLKKLNPTYIIEAFCDIV